MTKKRTSHAKRNTQKSQKPSWFWFLAGLISGMFIMFLVQLNGFKSQDITEKLPEATKKISKPIENIKDDVSEPVFEFYDRLKEQQVEVPEYQAPTEAEISKAATHEYFYRSPPSAKKVMPISYAPSLFS